MDILHIQNLANFNDTIINNDIQVISKFIEQQCKPLFQLLCTHVKDHYLKLLSNMGNTISDDNQKISFLSELDDMIKRNSVN